MSVNSVGELWSGETAQPPGRTVILNRGLGPPHSRPALSWFSGPHADLSSSWLKPAACGPRGAAGDGS